MTLNTEVLTEKAQEEADLVWQVIKRVNNALVKGLGKRKEVLGTLSTSDKLLFVASIQALDRIVPIVLESAQEAPDYSSALATLQADTTQRAVAAGLK